MDDYEEQMIKLQGVGKYHRYHFLRNTLRLVASLALLSFFLCYSSGFSLFPNSFSVYFSTFLFSFFTHSLERKYMFLICNGILAFLAKISLSSSSSPSESEVSASIIQKKASVTEEVYVDYGQAPLVVEAEEPDEDTYKNEVEDDQREQENGALLGGEEEEEETSESEVSVIVEDKEEYKGESTRSLVKQEEEEEEGGGRTAIGANEDVQSTEELNRKIEEFIRKMKEEIRIEAQQQIIAV
ncbi:hypothetical protein PTKIN_Ptkin13bG0167100 [Pterospermum kingtungense]